MIREYCGFYSLVNKDKGHVIDINIYVGVCVIEIHPTSLYI